MYRNVIIRISFLLNIIFILSINNIYLINYETFKKNLIIIVMILSLQLTILAFELM